MMPSMASTTNTFMVRIDPRVRLVTGFAASLLLATSRSWEAALAGLLVSSILCLCAGIPWAGLRPRLIAVNGFMLMLFVVMPWSVPGAPWWTVGAWIYSREGVMLAVLVAVKSNAILLILSALVSTIDTASLGHALEHLRLPRKLVHLFLFTVRYMEVLHEETRALLRAARARGFVPRMSRHTYHTMARLLGMVFIRSMDRSDRILAAMKARGYQGRFYLLNHFHGSSRDVAFGVVSTILLVLIAWMEWG